ncbi:hypothetical protein LWI29_015292 [Acer saccharum]|uniref:Uncharacterized protein n=1 Tax=Acer saccharum TaxID=4024 RepID=A0AA39T7R6_ACESA|nr:hypothetical protein LWI29_015292 [Acer saccharum]
MDPSLRSFLFNRMMQAMELGDKCTADKIESLIRNFRPDSPVPISVDIPFFENTSNPDISPPSFDNHQRDRLLFSPARPCSFDTEVNVVGEGELRKYKSRFDIPDSVTLLPGDRAVWNPPENAVAIYGAMLSCGVTLPLQPFIARWKNSWFFAGGEWGRNVPAHNRHNLLARKVPRHFTSPEAWSKAAPALTDREVSHLAAAAVLPLDSRGRSFLLDEEKMISSEIFTRLHARLPRLCDFDTVCDLQARAVKNSEAASKRHAAGLAKDGIASPDGDDHSDGGEEAGDVSRGVLSLSSDEEDVQEPAVAEAPPTQPEGSAEAENVAAPPSEGVNEQTLPATPPQPASPRPASPAVVVGEPGVSDQPRPSGPSESTDRPGPSNQAGTSASGSGLAREVPPTGPVEANEGSVSLFDFSATEICSHLANNDVYIGDGWGHVKNKSCNKKMEFFFNCHSLMMSEMGESYKFGIKASREIKRLREHASVLAAEKLSAEESHAQQSSYLRVKNPSQHLEAERVAEEAKEKAELEAADLRNQLSSRDLIFENLKAVLEAESVDRFKRSPAYDALLLREFEKGMRQAKKFFAMKDHSNEKALKRFDKSLQQHMAHGVDSIKDLRRWKAHCRYNRTEPHPMHLEIPSKRAFNTYYSGQKGIFWLWR